KARTQLQRRTIAFLILNSYFLIITPCSFSPNSIPTSDLWPPTSDLLSPNPIFYLLRPDNYVEVAIRSYGSSIHRDSEGSGGNAVSDDHKLARTVLLGHRHIEMSRHEIARCNAHAAVVMRPAIKHVSSSVVRDAHEWKVGCRLLIVPVSSSLRHA